MTFPAWVWDWPHQVAIYDELDGITARTIDRLGLSVPPRHTKTETVTIRYVAYRLIADPALRVVVACYNQTLANKFSRKIRRIVEGHIPLSRDRNAAEEWETAEGGGLRAVGVGAGITGQGFDLLVIDDPVKSREEADSLAYRERLYDWYRDDLYTRQEPGAAMVLIMTRWHEDDLAGRLQASEEGAEWRFMNLPALAEAGDPLNREIGEALCPDRYDVDALKRIQVALGSRGFNALYQGRPSAVEGDIFKRQWWRFWYPAGQAPPQPVVVRLEDGTLYECPQQELPATFDQVIQSWDCAFKATDTSDYVVGQVWARQRAEKFLLDQSRGRMDLPATIKAVLEISRRHPKAHAKLIEDKANGPAVISALRRTVQGIIEIEPEGGKVARANAVTATVEAGNVYLPHPSVAPWVSAFVEECSAFPNGAHDDQVDAMTQGLGRLIHYDWAGMFSKPDRTEDEEFAELTAELLGV